MCRAHLTKAWELHSPWLTCINALFPSKSTRSVFFRLSHSLFTTTTATTNNNTASRWGTAAVANSASGQQYERNYKGNVYSKQAFSLNEFHSIVTCSLHYYYLPFFALAFLERKSHCFTRSVGASITSSFSAPHSERIYSLLVFLSWDTQIIMILTRKVEANLLASLLTCRIN